jgi:hypothetical protein
LQLNAQQKKQRLQTHRSMAYAHGSLFVLPEKQLAIFLDCTRLAKPLAEVQTLENALQAEFFAEERAQETESL